jgi:dephospho-CoA kinase
MKVKTVAVTGGIGSGQSTVSNIFEKFGCKIINADQVARQIINTNTEIINELKNTFGTHFFDSTNKLKRKEFGKMIFANKNSTQKLNEIVHPQLVQELITEIETEEKLGKYKVIIIDAALIYELSIERFFDHIVVVFTNKETRIKRVRERDGATRQQIIDRMNNQFPLDEKREWADFIITNNGRPEDLEPQVFDVYEKILQT